MKSSSCILASQKVTQSAPPLNLLHIQVSAGDEPCMAGAEMSCMVATEMFCMAGAVVSRMARDGDVLYGRR
jgi:hypothetical protein